MIRTAILASVLFAAASAAPEANALSLNDVWVQKVEAGRYIVNWRQPGPVDVLVSTSASAAPAAMTLASDNDADGRAEVQVPAGARPYFMLRSETTGETLRVAERLLPLEGSSNFRDVGGYPAADGKRVKWGLLYRTGAMPSLTDADYVYLDKLGIKAICDLRTAEEREMIPTKWSVPNPPRDANVPYRAADLFGERTGQTTPAANIASGLYANGPVTLKAQYKQIFDALVAGEAPLAYNCSAGQDRTGIATALILSALGVPRHVIYSDYHLSTEYRRPDMERGSVDYAKFAPTNAMARMFMQYASSPRGMQPQPLYTANGESYLAVTFAEIDKAYGSVEAYLAKELGIDAAGVAKLRATYLE